MTTASPLLAFTGPIGSGKSTAADALVMAGWRRVKFAGPLRAMLRGLGLADADLDGPGKERPHPLLCGRTPRHAMQTLGSEWGRGCIDQEFWVHLAATETRRLLAQGQRVVIDDCRFMNEAAMVLGLGGRVVRVRRPGSGPSPPPGHVSEAGLANPFVSAEILNGGDVATLHASVRALAFSPAIA